MAFLKPTHVIIAWKWESEMFQNIYIQFRNQTSCRKLQSKRFIDAHGCTIPWKEMQMLIDLRSCQSPPPLPPPSSEKTVHFFRIPYSQWWHNLLLFCFWMFTFLVFQAFPVFSPFCVFTPPAISWGDFFVQIFVHFKCPTFITKCCHITYTPIPFLKYLALTKYD